MADPLSEVISLLQPAAVFSKGISGAGRWAVRHSDVGHPSFCAVQEGTCRLEIEGQDPIVLEAGEFVLMPATADFTLSGLEAAEPVSMSPPVTPPSAGEVRHGRQEGPAEVRLLSGYFVFGSDDAALLASLLPELVYVRAEKRLAILVELVGEESHGQRPGREHVLTRLLETLLIEALRSASGAATSPGLLRGLADTRLSPAIQHMHESPERQWTVEELATEAALSRSAFFKRFTRTVGLRPMAYLLAWRMALAKKLLRGNECGLAEVAERVGYGSANTFSTAFRRHVGQPPAQYARSH